jgi:hypothetical protein
MCQKILKCEHMKNEVKIEEESEDIGYIAIHI